MGPETTPECVNDLMQAVTCIKRAIGGMRGQQEDGFHKEQILDSNDAIDELTKITGALEKCLETQVTFNELLSGKMKCTTCGASSVGVCHSSPTGTQRSSEERRKVSEEEEDHDEKCSSIGSQRVASVDSSSSVDGFEHPIRSVSSSVSAPADEEETTMVEGMDDHELVMKTILNGGTVIPELTDSPREPVPVEITDSTKLDQFLQSSLLGLQNQNQNPQEIQESQNSLEKLEDFEDQNAVLASFFQQLIAGGNVESENNTDTSSSQPSPSNQESLALLETLLADALQSNNEAMNQEKNLPATNEMTVGAVATAKKRKSAPMRVPKKDDGAGYICPMEGCNKVFKEKGSVHRHFVTHIGMRFNCDKCKASYTQKHALMLHQKIHSNPDAYQCRGCGTNYTTQNGLRLHRQRNPACMEVANNTMDFSSPTLSKQPKQMVSAP